MQHQLKQPTLRNSQIFSHFDEETALSAKQLLLVVHSTCGRFKGDFKSDLSFADACYGLLVDIFSGLAHLSPELRKILDHFQNNGCPTDSKSAGLYKCLAVGQK
jgi:hypothetical protein